MLKRVVLVVSYLLLSHQALALDPLDEFYAQLKYLNARDKQIAENIANADTPDYKAQDLKKQSKSDNTHMYTTHPSHFSVGDEGGSYQAYDADFDEIKPNGNNVNVKAELFKKSENSSQLTEATNAYTKAKALVNLAIMGSGK